MKFSTPSGRSKKYPMIDGSYESVDYENLFYAGTLTHSLDFRRSSGGFIHGFRYTSKVSKYVSINLSYCIGYILNK